MDVIDLPHSDHGPRNATAVILLHGFPFDHRMWSAQKETLEAGGWRVIIPDLRGFGRAPVGHVVPTMREYANDVLRLADRAGLTSFVLVGFSMGGYVALEVARQAPTRLKGLALIDTRAEPDSDDARAGRAKSAEAVRMQGVQSIVDAMMPKMITTGAPERVREDTRALMLSQNPEGIVNALLAMGSRPDSRPTLSSIRASTLVLVGQEDPLTPPEAAKVFAAGIPGARYQVIQGAAHLTPMEKPDAVSDALVAWLKDLH